MGSTSIVTDASGNLVSQTKYKAWGQVRYSSGTTPTQYTFTGQMDYTGDFGLMFFNARWLDVSLGRFTQADSIIPPGVQGLDRYAYVNNSPLNYVDPSGHLSCEHANAAEAEGDCTDQSFDDFMKNEYGVSFSRGWTPRDKQKAYKAVKGISEAFAGATGKNGAELFRTIFGEMEFSMGTEGSTTDWYCEATGSGFGCSNASGKIDERLIVHELGHEFRNRFYSLTGIDIYSVLGGDTIKDAQGNYVSGMRNGSWNRTFDGYRSSRAPSVYHGMNWDDWNKPSEETADMFMNWVFDSFKDDLAGEGRYSWMNTNMADWLVKFP